MRQVNLTGIWLAISLSFLSVGLYAAQLPLKDLDKQFAATQKAWEVPGLAIAIVKNDKVVFAKGYGVREINKPAPVTADTLFAIASNSKAFTAATIAMLVDEGKLDWDDKVVDYLPWFRVKDDYASREMTIRDLLSHRSGLGTYSGDLIWYGTDYSAEEVVKRARYVPTDSSFRSKYAYSNLMFIAAGEVVHHISGQPWPDYVKKNILNKIGMRNTVLSVHKLPRKRNVATPHRIRDGKTIALPWYRWDNMSAAGGIISSVNDMSKWLRLQLNQGKQGGKQIFSENSSYTMWSPHTIIPVSKKKQKKEPSTHFAAYGLGWSLKDYQGKKIIAHGGGYDGMFSRVVLVPEEKLGVVVLTNGMTSVASVLANIVVDSALGIKGNNWSEDKLASTKKSRKKAKEKHDAWVKARIKNTKPSLNLEDYAGKYHSVMYGDAMVEIKNGKLELSLLPNPDFVADLSHWQHDTFALTWRKDFAWFDGGTVQFVLDKNSKVTEIKIDVPNGDFWFTELELKRVKEKKGQ